MKNTFKILALSFLGLGASFVSCKKEVPNIYNQFTDVKVTLDGKDPLSVVDHKIVNDGDSIYFVYTVESPNTDMYQINLYKMGTNTPIIRLPITDPQQRRKTSGIFRLKMDAGVGKHTYRIYPTDKEGVYLGDDYKKFTVEVANNYVHIPNRQIFLPDSAQGNLNSFISLATGDTYNYASTGATNSAKIDLGIYRKLVSNAWQIFLYSPSANPNPFAPFNLASWTKRETLFSDRTAGAAGTFLTTLNSALNIRKNATAKPVALKSLSNGMLVGGMVYFLTPEGKYGALVINAISQTYDGKPFINVSIKYEQ